MRSIPPAEGLQEGATEADRLLGSFFFQQPSPEAIPFNLEPVSGNAIEVWKGLIQKPVNSLFRVSFLQFATHRHRWRLCTALGRHLGRRFALRRHGADAGLPPSTGTVVISIKHQRL